MSGPKPPPSPPPPPLQPCPPSSNNSVHPPRSPARSPVALHRLFSSRSPSKSNKLLKRFRSVIRSFPTISTPPACKFPAISLHGANSPRHNSHVRSGTRITGTLFGYRRSRIYLAIQENPMCLPMLLLELSVPTRKLLQDMGLGLITIALECEKNPSRNSKLISEPIWNMYCNGQKTGYAVKREPTGDDLKVMQVLHAMSMGAGVLPGYESPEGELTYVRAFFERVVGSEDSETYYMMNPNGDIGPELSIFFVRI